MNPVMLALVAPLAVGPSPSAHEVRDGFAATLEASAITGERAAGGGRLALSYSAKGRLWSEVSVQHGTSWPLCPDCGATAVDMKVRGTLVRHPNFNLAPWVVGSVTPGGVDGTVGAAVEGGTKRLRFDTSWPVVSSHELLTTLRIMPEAGISAVWSDTQRTRFAMVGLEPGFAVQHTSRLGESALVLGVRVGEEGVGGQAAFQWAL